MEGLTQQLIRFVKDTEYADLPEKVIHESKRVLLDSVGCATAGLATEKGKLSVELARRLGGPPESTIIGVGDRVSCANAAFANGELINALDFDALCGGHAPPILIPAVLATAEYTCASGKDLILGIALSHEIATRISQALTRVITVVREGPDRAKAVISPVLGYGHCVIGAAAGVGKIMKLNRDKLASAIGLAGYICPVAPMKKWCDTVLGSLAKYTVSGWVAQAGVTAGLLAESGYTGDHTVLDGEYGFWRFYNPTKWEPAIITQELGKAWFMLNMGYKPWPTCMVMHTALDCFTHLIEENKLQPDEIKKVRVFLPEYYQDIPLWKSKVITNHVEASFSAAYNIACAAYRLKLIDWQDDDTIKDTRIQEFLKKVDYHPYPNWALRVIEEPTTYPSAVEVIARGKTFREERNHHKGAFVGSDATVSMDERDIMTDDELSQKFRANTVKLLPSQKVDKTLEIIWNLEKLKDVSLLSDEMALK